MCRHMPILETVGHGHNFPCKFFKIYLCTHWGQTLIAIGQHMAVHFILKRKISIQESKEWIYRNNQNIITINKRQYLFTTNCFLKEWDRLLSLLTEGPKEERKICIWNIFPTCSYDLFLFIIWITKYSKSLFIICLVNVSLSLFFISWRLITLQYCSGFCHTLTWISHGDTCIPHPDPPSHLPLHPIPLGLPSARESLFLNALLLLV